jgi:hypothetical protein
MTIKLPGNIISIENFLFFQNAIDSDSDKQEMFSCVCRHHFNVYEIYSLDHLAILKKFTIIKWSGLQK